MPFIVRSKKESRYDPRRRARVPDPYNLLRRSNHIAGRKIPEGMKPVIVQDRLFLEAFEDIRRLYESGIIFIQCLPNTDPAAEREYHKLVGTEAAVEAETVLPVNIEPVPETVVVVAVESEPTAEAELAVEVEPESEPALESELKPELETETVKPVVPKFSLPKTAKRSKRPSRRPATRSKE